MNHWSARYVGVPWLDRGRDHHGCDCWGLVRLVYAERFDIELPSYADDYVSAAEAREVAELIAAERDGGRPGHQTWIRTVHPSEGDVLLFRWGRAASHVGIAIGADRMLHMARDSRATIERLDVEGWALRLVGAWRHVGRIGA